MESLKGINIPVIADSVLDPELYYGHKITGIYFQTEDDLFGRITFYNLDALKVCRGEVIPYECDWGVHAPGTWIFKVNNSKWLKERFEYEHENYGSAYEWGGDVSEMLTDFSHYLFSFHDQFIEVVAKGFWFEKDSKSLFGKELQDGHPFLPLPEAPEKKILAYNLTCQVRVNTNHTSDIIANSAYCPQKLFEFALELDGRTSVNNTVIITSHQGKVVSRLRGYLGDLIAEFNGVATLEEVKPHVEKYMSEIYERRKAMGK